MDLRNKSIDELIRLAVSTMCIKEMFFLQSSPSMNVRRALARNRNVPSNILENLEHDPVENVSYMASKHPNAKSNRNFDNLRACVLCEKAEQGLVCTDCIHVKGHSF